LIKQDQNLTQQLNKVFNLNEFKQQHGHQEQQQQQQHPNSINIKRHKNPISKQAQTTTTKKTTTRVVEENGKEETTPNPCYIEIHKLNEWLNPLLGIANDPRLVVIFFAFLFFLFSLSCSLSLSPFAALNLPLLVFFFVKSD
jgi:hypothetical protein